MNKEILKGKWNQAKGDAKIKWGNLTDDDLDKVNGSYDKMVGLIQERYGKDKEAAEKEVKAWQKKHE